MKLGDRIKRRRAELHMSAGELASLIGKNRATIYRYENGDIENIPLDMLDPLAEALDLMPEYLLGWTDSNCVGSIVSTTDGESGMVYVRMKESHARSYERWFELFDGVTFTEEEFQKVIEYTRFLLYLRTNKK